MSDTPSERRLAENEVVFRELNERIQKGFDETNRLAAEDNQPEYLLTHEIEGNPLHFFCECSDDKCTARVQILPAEYTRIHQRRDHFVTLPGHEVASIERIVEKTADYVVVEKFDQPPPSADRLNPTSFTNA